MKKYRVAPLIAGGLGIVIANAEKAEDQVPVNWRQKLSLHSGHKRPFFWLAGLLLSRSLQAGAMSLKATKKINLFSLFFCAAAVLLGGLPTDNVFAEDKAEDEYACVYNIPLASYDIVNLLIFKTDKLQPGIQKISKQIEPEIKYDCRWQVLSSQEVQSVLDYQFDIIEMQNKRRAGSGEITTNLPTIGPFVSIDYEIAIEGEKVSFYVTLWSLHQASSQDVWDSVLRRSLNCGELSQNTNEYGFHEAEITKRNCKDRGIELAGASLNKNNPSSIVCSSNSQGGCSLNWSYRNFDISFRMDREILLKHWQELMNRVSADLDSMLVLAINGDECTGELCGELDLGKEKAR